MYRFDIVSQYLNIVFPQVNGELVNLPVSLGDGKLTVHKSGWHAVLATNFGLKVSFDWYSAVYVTLPSTYMGAVCGLCGNYNGKGLDDLIPRNGATPVRPVDFGASWRVEEIPGCIHGCKGVCPDCDRTQKRQYETSDFCGLLKDPKGPFRNCHKKVDPTGLFEDCVYDVCLYKGSRDVLCQAITDYTAACQAAGVEVYSWRTRHFCGKNFTLFNNVKKFTWMRYGVSGIGLLNDCKEGARVFT